MTSVNLQADKLDIFSAALGQHAEITPAVLLKKGIAAGTNIGVTQDPTTGILTISGSGSGGGGGTANPLMNYLGGYGTMWIDNTHISIAPGDAVDASKAGVITTTTTFTKDLSAVWVAGTAQGMRSAAGWADGTWHVFAIGDVTATHAPDIFADTSLTPALPTGYTMYRRICSLVVVGGQIRRYIQSGTRFWWYNFTQTVTPGGYDWAIANYQSGNQGPENLTLSVPIGIPVIAKISAYTTVINGGATRLSFWPKVGAPMAMTGSYGWPGFAASSAYAGDDTVEIECLTDNLGQVQFALFCNALGGGSVYTKGYIDLL